MLTWVEIYKMFFVSEMKGRNIFDRPPTRSGGGKTESEEEKPKPKAGKIAKISWQRRTEI